jgi:hypothetical protein
VGQGSQPAIDPRLQERFSSHALEALSVWCQNMEYTIEFSDWLGGGRSGAMLAAIYLNGSKGARKAVLKYCPSQHDRPPLDFQSFRRAARSGPRGFARQHLVRLDPSVKEPIQVPKGLFLVMEYRSEGHDRYNTMSVLLDRSALGIACKTIMPRILEKWNNVRGNPRLEPGGMQAQEFLQEILGRRCGQGGSISLTVERLEASIPDLYTTNSGQRLPRPLAAVISGENIANVRLPGFRGNAHGDLHTDNILIPVPVNVPPSVAHFEKFLLIDLSTFRADRLLAVDPAHLFLSITSRRLPSLDEQARDRLADLILDPAGAESGTIPSALAQTVQEIHQAGAQFAERRRLYDEWHRESLAAIVACALLFVGREAPDNDLRWFLRLAGRAIGLLANMPLEPAADAVREVAASKTQDDERNVIPIRNDLDPPGNALPHSREVSVLAVDGLAESYVDLARELVQETKDLYDDLPAQDAVTATTTVRVIAEELTIALGEMNRWHEVHRPEPHVTYITAIGAARVQLGEVLRMLDSIRGQGITQATLEGLSEATELLLGAAQDIVRVNRSGRLGRPLAP